MNAPSPKVVCLFNSAVRIARRQRYSEAAELVRRALEKGHCSRQDALDLQARVFVQQGRYLEAEASWRKALEMDPQNLAYHRALIRLRTPRARGPAKVAATAVGVLVVLWLGIGTIQTSRSTYEIDQGIRQIRASLQKVEDTLAHQGAKLDRLALGAGKVDAKR